MVSAEIVKEKICTKDGGMKLFAGRIKIINFIMRAKGAIRMVAPKATKELYDVQYDSKEVRA